MRASFSNDPLLPRVLQYAGERVIAAETQAFEDRQAAAVLSQTTQWAIAAGDAKVSQITAAATATVVANQQAASAAAEAERRAVAAADCMSQQAQAAQRKRTRDTKGRNEPAPGLRD